MIYYFIVGVSTCNRKTNDQDNDGNIKNKTTFKHFSNNRFIKLFSLKTFYKEN